MPAAAPACGAPPWAGPGKGEASWSGVECRLTEMVPNTMFHSIHGCVNLTHACVISRRSLQHDRVQNIILWSQQLVPHLDGFADVLKPFSMRLDSGGPHSSVVPSRLCAQARAHLRRAAEAPQKQLQERLTPALRLALRQRTKNSVICVETASDTAPTQTELSPILKRMVSTLPSMHGVGRCPA